MEVRNSSFALVFSDSVPDVMACGGGQTIVVLKIFTLACDVLCLLMLESFFQIMLCLVAGGGKVSTFFEEEDSDSDDELTAVVSGSIINGSSALASGDPVGAEWDLVRCALNSLRASARAFARAYSRYSL